MRKEIIRRGFKLNPIMFLGRLYLWNLCFFMMLSLVSLPSAQAIDFTAWTDSASNPLFVGGSTSGVNRAYYPSVIKVGSVYHIWYGDGANTRHATSTNIDFTGATFPAPVVTGLVATSPYHPRVLYNASGWTIGGNFYAGPFLMYYTDGYASNWTLSPRVAHSADGHVWIDIGPCTGVNSYSTNSSIYNLDVIYEGGTTWKAYADNGLGHIEYYVSANGIDWTGTAHNILGSLQPWETSFTSPHVIKSGSQYIMYYGSGTVNNQGIGVAFSADGQNFTKSGSNPIFSISDGFPWRNDRTYTPFVIPNGASWIMYYTGRSSSTGNYSIGYALPSTPSGANVTVTFPNGGSVTFSSVLAECYTSLTEVTNPTHTPPPNFNFIRYGYFDISTNCSYTGPVTVTYPYDESEISGQEQNLKLLHWNSGGWEDSTVSVDTVNNTITGRVNSLSPFGIGYYLGSGGGGGGYSTGANENMIAVIAILAISAGLFILRRQKWLSV